MARRPRVVIVGAGFGGLEAAKRLAGKPVDVTVIDRRNHHLFQPLLYQVATCVEKAGAVAELARQSVSRDFRSITPHCSRVLLIEAGSRLLPSFPADLSRRSLKALEQLGVEVRLGEAVTEIGQHHVRVGS